MEVIELTGYTEDEKLEIAKRYLVRRQLEANGLKAEQATITDAALRQIARDHTREAGVRNLERMIGAVLRNVAVRIAEGRIEQQTHRRRRSAADPGRARFENEVAMRTSVPAWPRARLDAGRRRHPVHRGDARAGQRQLILTGQLGDVMKESAQARCPW
jgi:ATP-dependent Lon protease